MKQGKTNNKNRKTKNFFRFITSDEFRRTGKFFFCFPPPRLDKIVLHD